MKINKFHKQVLENNKPIPLFEKGVEEAKAFLNFLKLNNHTILVTPENYSDFNIAIKNTRENLPLFVVQQLDKIFKSGENLVDGSFTLNLNFSENLGMVNNTNDTNEVGNWDQLAQGHQALLAPASRENIHQLPGEPKIFNSTYYSAPTVIPQAPKIIKEKPKYSYDLADKRTIKSAQLDSEFAIQSWGNLSLRSGESKQIHFMKTVMEDIERATKNTNIPRGLILDLIGRESGYNINPRGNNFANIVDTEAENKTYVDTTAGGESYAIQFMEYDSRESAIKDLINYFTNPQRRGLRYQQLNQVHQLAPVSQLELLNEFKNYWDSSFEKKNSFGDLATAFPVRTKFEHLFKELNSNGNKAGEILTKELNIDIKNIDSAKQLFESVVNAIVSRNYPLLQAENDSRVFTHFRGAMVLFLNHYMADLLAVNKIIDKTTRFKTYKLNGRKMNSHLQRKPAAEFVSQKIETKNKKTKVPQSNINQYQLSALSNVSRANNLVSEINQYFKSNGSLNAAKVKKEGDFYKVRIFSKQWTLSDQNNLNQYLARKGKAIGIQFEQINKN